MRSWITAALLLALGLSLAGCGNDHAGAAASRWDGEQALHQQSAAWGPLEDRTEDGDALEQAGEDLKDAAKNAGDTAKQAAKDAGQAVKRAAEDAGQAAKDMGEDAKRSAESIGKSAQDALEDAADDARTAADRAGK